MAVLCGVVWYIGWMYWKTKLYIHTTIVTFMCYYDVLHFISSWMPYFQKENYWLWNFTFLKMCGVLCLRVIILKSPFWRCSTASIEFFICKRYNIWALCGVLTLSRLRAFSFPQGQRSQWWKRCVGSKPCFSPNCIQ